MPRGIYNRKTAKPRRSSSLRKKSVTKQSPMVSELTHEDVLGKSVYQDDNFEVRVLLRDDRLLVYAFRREGKITQLPRGFILGSNALMFTKGAEDADV